MFDVMHQILEGVRSKDHVTRPAIGLSLRVTELLGGICDLLAVGDVAHGE